jgi:hypothetical protein
MKVTYPKLPDTEEGEVGSSGGNSEFSEEKEGDFGQ